MRGLPGQSFAAPEIHRQQLPLPGLGGGGSGAFTLTLRGLLGRFLGSAVSNSAGYAIGGALLPTLEPLTQDIANKAWESHTVKPLAAAVAAEASVRGFMDDTDAQAEAARTGFSDDRYDTLKLIHGQTPPIETLATLRRRDLISPGEFAEGIAQLGYLPQWRGLLRNLTNVLPSVTDMVRFAVREVYDPAARSALDLDAELPGAFVQDAGNVGLSPERAGQFWAAHWELPSYEQGAQMLFRTNLGAAGFSGLLKALDYAPTWRAKLEEIARPIPPLSDMIRFAVRDVYTPSTVNTFGLDEDFPDVFAQQAALHGMEPPYPQQYWMAHWRLPSAQQGYRMLWRDELTPQQLNVLLKALDYPPFFREKLANIAHLVPGRIDLKRMLRHDILNRQEVKAGYQRLGYSVADAEHLTAIAEAELTASTTSQVWATRARSRLFTVTHNEFVDGSIDEARVQELLATIGVPVAERAIVLTQWRAELAVNRLELTPAQIRKALERTLYDAPTAVSELMERGMTLDDAKTFLKSGLLTIDRRAEVDAVTG